MKRSLVWFKTDLRLDDNETLIKAITESDEIIPVYCIDDANFKTTEFGFKKTGSFKTQFLIESLIDLNKNLRSRGSGLIILNGKPHEEIIKIAKEYNVSKVFAKREVAFEEIETEAAVEKELFKHHIVLETFSTSTLYHAKDLPFTINKIPDVFTDFRKKVEKETSIRAAFNKPEKIKSPKLPDTEFPNLKNLCLQDIKPDHRMAFDFIGGETNAIKRLNYYLWESNCIKEYKNTRNEMIGADYSSKLSPWLALGCISARRIYDEVKKYEKERLPNESTYWLIFELIWRDYFRFMMKKYKNKFFTLSGIKTDKITVNELNPDVLEKWINGKTGSDFIDANMRELKNTGYISNRGRQNVASYLCNDLKLDWRLGAAYFEEMLIDYDVCSNWGNWAYIAGVGNDPRENRYFNIEKQADTYDHDGKYRNLWLNN